MLDVVVCFSVFCTYPDIFTLFQWRMTEKYKHFGWGHFYPPPPWLLTCFENLGSMSVNMYRPPSSQISTFLDEFQNLLEIFVPSPSTLTLIKLILTNFLASLIISISLSTSTFQLDLLIIRSSSTVIVWVNPTSLDHKSFTFKFFSYIRPTTERTTIHPTIPLMLTTSKPDSI